MQRMENRFTAPRLGHGSSPIVLRYSSEFNLADISTSWKLRGFFVWVGGALFAAGVSRNVQAPGPREFIRRLGTRSRSDADVSKNFAIP